jgi:hypothetical protein
MAVTRQLSINRNNGTVFSVRLVSKCHTQYVSQWISKWLRWRYQAKTEKYRHDFSSERAPHINKPETVKKIIKERRGKIGRGSQMDARYQNRLSVVIYL